MVDHQDPRTRMMHYVGSTGALIAVAAAFIFGPVTLFAGLVWAYGFAWGEHFLFEGNKPATSVRARWYFVADWKMFSLWLTGRLGSEIERGRGLKDPTELIRGAK
jgi:hypothetical protein